MDKLSVAITAVARKDDGRLLRETLDSVRKAGLPEPKLFFDEDKIGPYRNFQIALGVASLSDDPILILQDDIQLTAGLDVDKIVEAAEKLPLAVLSLYCVCSLESKWRSGEMSDVEHAPLVDGSRWIAGNKNWFFGALAVLLNAETARKFMANPTRKEHTSCTDTSLGRFCLRDEVPYLIHYPSLVRHTGVGDLSSIFNWSSSPDRQCGSFLPSADATYMERFAMADGKELWHPVARKAD